MQTRQEIISTITNRSLDALVIGGGIVGSGVARDAALRGLNVALVDRYDFAFGTSSRSSRLLHGGLRYLAQGRLGLVREASVEKVIIHKIAPHLAAPLPFIFPTRSGTEWKKWKLRIGVKIYDILCSGRNLGKSTGLSRDEVLKVLPQLNTDHLTGAVRYFDGLTNDARLVLDTLRSAAANGAHLLNYTGMVTSTRENDLWNCRLHDHLTDTPIEVKAKCVINASGAWAPSFAQSGVKLRLTKGVHIVIDRSRLSVPDAVVMAEGKRILFAIPWGDRVILGTTDTDYDGPLDAPGCDAEDIRYILQVANYTFPSAKLNTEDVISGWSGLRPLIAPGEKGTPSDISRAHQIKEPHPGWIDVAGGKLTTYRLMAEQTVDRVVAVTGASSKPCTTATTPLLVFPPLPPEAAEIAGWKGRGEGAPKEEFSGILPPPVSKEAIEHFCANEWAIHLSDVMIRRTSWRYYHRNHLAIARDVAAWMQQSLNWTDVQREEELKNYNRLAETACGFASQETTATNQVQPA